MTLAVCSMFRDSQRWHGRPLNQVGRFFTQLEATGLSPAYFLIEGESEDDTFVELQAWAHRLPGRVSLAAHGPMGGAVASVEDDARFRRLSEIGNVPLRRARDSGADLVLWVESDFVLPDGWLDRLLEATGLPWWETALGVCPVPVFGSPEGFYDTWAFEGEGGRRWGNHEVPAAPPGERYLPLAAAGSCILFRGDALRARPYEFEGGGCLPGLCRAAVADGLPLFCDTAVRVTHPSSENVCGRLI